MIYLFQKGMATAILSFHKTFALDTGGGIFPVHSHTVNGVWTTIRHKTAYRLKV